jgi:glycosyltransferase involved in cell wall biosynthesis
MFTLQPLISIVIPSYNGAAFLTEAVDSALNQTYHPTEVIIVDDGSTDDTRSVLERYGDRIRYVYQKNRGLAGARNSGIMVSNGSFLAFLDSDDVWFPEKLEKQYPFFLRDQRIGLVHSDVYDWYPERGEKAINNCGRHCFDGDCLSQLYKENRVLPSSVVLKKHCIDSVGVFDEKLRSAEDWDLWIRVARRFLFGYVDEPLVLYRQHIGNMSRNYALMHEGELQVVRKHFFTPPSRGERLGGQCIRERLFRLNFGLGYHYFKEKNFDKARGYFKSALKNRMVSGYAPLYFACTFCTPQFVRILERFKRFFTQLTTHLKVRH